MLPSKNNRKNAEDIQKRKYMRQGRIYISLALANIKCGGKKRNHERMLLQEMEDSRNNGNMRIFYKEVKSQKKNFQPRMELCRN